MKANQSDDKVRNGVRKETFRDGKVSAVGRYADGKKTGVWKYYDASGKLSRTKPH